MALGNTTLDESSDLNSLSGIHLRGCGGQQVWLSDDSGVLLRLDMSSSTARDQAMKEQINGELHLN